MMHNRRFQAAVIACALMLASCAFRGPGGVSGGSQESFRTVYPEMPEESVLVMKGSVRIELPRYRVRGSCSVRRYPDGSLQVDFLHSSLFGSYREEATIYIDGAGMLIHDLEREQVWDGGEAVSMLSSNLGIRVLHDDLVYILLLARPPVEGEAQAGRGGWSVSGSWGGRSARLDFDDAGRTRSARICSEDGSPCYEIKYGYDGDSLFPGKVAVSSATGPERLSFVVSSVSEEALTSSGEG